MVHTLQPIYCSIAAAGFHAHLLLADNGRNKTKGHALYNRTFAHASVIDTWLPQGVSSLREGISLVNVLFGVGYAVAWV